MHLYWSECYSFFSFIDNNESIAGTATAIALLLTVFELFSGSW